MYKLLLIIIFTIIFSFLKQIFGFENIVLSTLSVIFVNTLIGDKT